MISVVGIGVAIAWAVTTGYGATKPAAARLVAHQLVEERASPSVEMLMCTE